MKQSQQYQVGSTSPISGPTQQQLAQQNLVKFKYRIVYCTGEDPEYPVTELLDPTPNSRGWQSQKFCEFPQEIIIQFPTVVKLKQLQFLSHQSKIASKIELFTFVPSGSQAQISQIPLNEIQFKRLGYLSLDANERSGFQARELKSVYVDSASVLLKLIFHKCHLNNFNVFNQIGLVALNCIGQNMNQTPLDTNPTQTPSSVPGSASQKTRYPNSQYDGLDPDMIQKIKILEQAKVKSVENENFDEASKIKNAIDKMKNIGMHISQLDERKRLASMNEDYDAAKVIKQEIDKLKIAAHDPWIEQIIQKTQPSQKDQYMRHTQNHFQGQSHSPFNQSQQNFAPSQQQLTQQNFGIGKGMPPPQMATNLEQEVDRFNLGGDQPKRGKDSQQRLDEDAISPPSLGQALPQKKSSQPLDKKKPSMKYAEDEDNYEDQYDRGPVNVDEQVVPTLNKDTKSKPQEYETEGGYQAEEDKEAEPLTGEKAKQAEPLMRVFGESEVRKVFSKVWQLREEGISNIENTILNEGVGNEAKAFVNGVGIARFTVGDKMAQVSQRGMQFLTNLCKNLQPSLQPQLKGELQSYSDVTIQMLVEKLGDNLNKLRASAEDALMAVAEHPQFGVQPVLNVMTRPVPPTAAKDAKKTVLSNKHIIGKYSILLKMLQEYEFSNEQCQTAVKFVMKGIQHQLQDVRNVAYKCMTELYRFMGNGIMKYLDELRPAQMEQLQGLFAEIDGGAFNQQVKAKQQKETITTNIDPQGIKGKKKSTKIDDNYTIGGGQSEPSPINKKAQPIVKKGAQKKPAPQDYDEPQQNVDQACQFCGHADQDLNEEALDIHYWKECPMLTQCWECNQVIEIAGLDEHLLEECENRDEYKLCPKCKSVVRVEEFNSHDHIKPNPAGAAKCQLCKESVYPVNEQGWKKHILEDKCSGNMRMQ